MKCVHNLATDEVKRVSDDEAWAMVKGGWDYCPKSKWKAVVRVSRSVKKEEDEEGTAAQVADDSGSGKKKTRRHKKSNKSNSKKPEK